MTEHRLPVSAAVWPVALVLLGALAGGCDLVVDKIQEEVNRPSTGGGSGPTPPSPVPPPVTDPGPAKMACASTSQCGKGLTCSTEWGVCNAPPGCEKGGTCPAVCYGTCESEKPACTTDKDCRLVADYCTGCDCRALGSAEPDPVCTGPGVRCLVDPCQNKTAVCSAGRCVAQAPPPPPCSDTILAGDDTTCRTSSEWKQYAYEACLAKGMNLTNYSTGGGDCGPDKTHQVKFTCCPAVTTPPPPPPPAPTPPPGVCTGAGEGGSTSCKSPSTWKSYASDACAKQGLALTELHFGEECGGGNYRYVKYTCCSK